MTQLALVRRLLRERGSAGVSAFELIYTHGITRAASVVHTLRHREGMEIRTVERPGETAHYILVSPRRADEPPRPVGVPGWACTLCAGRPVAEPVLVPMERFGRGQGRCSTRACVGTLFARTGTP